MSRAVPFTLSDVPNSVDADAAVRLWLLAVAGLVLLMIAIGGATRLTGSGLSITEWQPIMGIIPPLNDAAWLDAFAKYKAIPQYSLVNKGMSVDAFKFIFWWEWAHRFLGRLIGLAFALPLAWFWLRGRIRPDMKVPLLGLLLLGGLQGFIGWFMVSSGLSERIDVSQYRLALHLSMAFVLLGGLLWLAMRSAPPGNTIRTPEITVGDARMAGAVVALIFLQVVAGAFVAGLKAGLTYNTWPLMDGHVIPAGLGTLSPWYANAFENITAVQFNHRMLAYVVVAAVAWHAWQLIRTADDERLRMSAVLLIAVVVAQAAVGIWTLLWAVPLPLGLAHQGGAAVLFAISVRHLYLVRAGVTPLRA
jgi:heme a synthase